MTLRGKILTGGALLAIFASAAFAQENREIRVTEDRDQAYFTSKVYELKHTIVCTWRSPAL
jgi:hypothetical protein